MLTELNKLRQFCAYQERSHHETRYKCLELGLRGEEVDQAIAALIADNFLNEERFAKAFAGGKFRIKQWGRKKILLELKQRQVSAYCIKKAMEEIDMDDYIAVLEKITAKKYLSLNSEPPIKRKYKTIQYLLSRGYEQDLIQDALEKVNNDNSDSF
ncbi:RecX family transcriptional regulator [Chitinophaga silvatica]|uniref:Regulatory protein RecX n=1 Tax=Chitinophaga silvatica TaxID=2282649 RepID=A0A3E1YCM4_9BACT|nr:regulatory protein RecX [Chitinophaga silvatica]RFS24009.1 RecX family transcriptional regulator [Chitinophaga silvatica]